MTSEALIARLQESCDHGLLSKESLGNLKGWLSPAYQSIHESGLSPEQWITRWLQKENWTTLENRFFRRLSPGTAGIRGTLGIGSALMNEATCGLFVAAHAAYLTAHPLPGREGIVLGYDSRYGSFDMDLNGPGHLTRLVAEIYAAFQIPVYLADTPLPTPVIAHAVVEIGFGSNHLLPAGGGICTASHNPKEDNGYKIYEADGHQVVSDPVIRALQTEIDRTTDYGAVRRAPPLKGWPASAASLREAIASPSGTLVLATAGAPITLFDSGRVIAAYCLKARQVAIQVESQDRENFHFKPEILDALSRSPLVLTALKGNCTRTAGALLFEHGLREGVHFHFVPEEAAPDNSLDTGTGRARGKPNPEYPESFHRSRQFLQTLRAGGVNSRLVFASDPDSDRMGIMEVLQDGRERFFSGNEQLSLNAAYETRHTPAPEKALVIQSVPSSRQAARIYECHWPDVAVRTVMVGFKNFGQIIAYYNNRCIDHQQERSPDFDRKAYADLSLATRQQLLREAGCLVFMSGGEESMGQTYGNDCAEKDTPRAMARFAEMAGWLEAQGETFASYFDTLQDQYGFHAENMIATRLPGADGERLKEKIMETHRDPSLRPRFFGDQQVLAIMDYKHKGTQGATCVDPEGEILFTGAFSENFYHLPNTPLNIATFTVDLKTGDRITLPSTDYIQYVLQNGSSVHIRPSGTEPLLKHYLNFELSEVEILDLPDVRALFHAPALRLLPDGTLTVGADSQTPDCDLRPFLDTDDPLVRNRRIREAWPSNPSRFKGWQELDVGNKTLFLKAVGYYRQKAREMLQARFHVTTRTLQDLMATVAN